jgi:S-phase kinase-associated protein 1
MISLLCCDLDHVNHGLGAFWARPPSKQINLISSDGVTFEVDYDAAVALMSHRSTVGKLSPKLMIIMIEYCKAHKHDSGMNYFKIRDWDAQFIDVDLKTLLDYTTCACYMEINSLAKQM